MSATSVDSQAQVDAKLPKYVNQGGVTGNLNSTGSGTLNTLMTYWTEGFGDVVDSTERGPVIFSSNFPQAVSMITGIC